ncbi:hypothetical protein S820908_013 [Synechococcus phage S-CAM9]|uniref:Uncharacterized protein n=1 Tax=Synechococcus phage S-CAM9 TaxID=1883369 RepID=A0A1D8KPL4_9CAUD|nr:tail protein [Synechococcus phage S-CAM9]AOV60160.1 hypothetical protein S050808_013 [Synechococcus phage S-CAM9]AOV60388.1 hypothetical protein S820908_013 [Synechococcus phage S-CAM9]AOV60616.1 hypothetical protein N161109_013 [Synechococcus phage S-CAM9]
MSYVKNVKITNVKITSLNGKTAEIGNGISGIFSFDYFESIFKPSVGATLIIGTTNKIVSELPIRGTENVTLTILHDSGNVEFTDWVISSVSEPSTTSTQSTLVLVLTTSENIKQELKSNRLTQRYDPKVPISTHVSNILGSLGTEKPIDIEKTANSYGFFGNYWRPFKAIYWLAKRSMGTGGGDRAGFLFWETKSGYKFKSIDTIAADAKTNAIQTFTQSEIVNNLDDSDNFKILAPFFEYNQSVINKMRKGTYGDNVKYFNPYNLPQGFQPEKTHTYSESFEKLDRFGTEDRVDLNFNVHDNPTTIDVNPYVSGTMTQDGTVDPETDSGSPQKWNHSMSKYQQILSQSLRLTVPMNLELEAGLPINLDLLSSNKGLDSHESGVYLIKDLRHTIRVTDNGGIECFTNLRCIRDNYGNDGINTNVTLLNS